MIRVLPSVDDANRYFWEAGAEGELRFLQCQTCGLYAHPPAPTCRNCRGTALTPVAVSGLGTVLSFTINRHPWTDDDQDPYVIAIVGMDEQDDLHLTTNIVGCDVDDVTIGQRVEVEWIHLEDVWLPVFHPLVPVP